jgi:hypothetical protein
MLVAGSLLAFMTVAYAAANSGGWWRHSLSQPVVVTSFLNV